MIHAVLSVIDTELNIHLFRLLYYLILYPVVKDIFKFILE